MSAEQRKRKTRQEKKTRRLRRERHPRQEILTRKRRNALANGHEFAITEADLDWPTHCPVTGVKLYYGGQSGPNGATRSDAVSIDRIDSTRGYVPGNVVIVSKWANHRKGDATIDQLRRLYEFYESLGVAA